MLINFDIWGNADGQIKATAAVPRFVTDSDAPYGFDRHLLRVPAVNARGALAAYRAKKLRNPNVVRRPTL